MLRWRTGDRRVRWPLAATGGRRRVGQAPSCGSTSLLGDAKGNAHLWLEFLRAHLEIRAPSPMELGVDCSKKVIVQQLDH